MRSDGAETQADGGAVFSRRTRQRSLGDERTEETILMKRREEGKLELKAAAADDDDRPKQASARARMKQR